MSSITSAPPTDDNTGLLQLLTDDWTESNRTLVQNSPWTNDYLGRLTSLSLDELSREPTTLRSNQHQVKLDAQQLAYTDYPSFLHAESCRRELGSTLESLDNHFSDLLTAAPALQQACEEFATQAKEIAQERAKMTRVLEHQHVLMDLLELPQLMDTCVWNGYYSEAMDLAAHVRLLQVRYPLPVIRTIYDRIQASSDLMLIQLISHLRQPIKLAVAMNIIGHLRRIEVFDSERELRMVFLRCRHNCMEQRLEKIKKPVDDSTVSIVSSSSSSPTATSAITSMPTNSQDTFDYLKRYVDVMREQMFEMATHYMSIFSSNETDTILSDYMTHMVMQIQHVLSEHLRYIDDTSALASLLTQLQYCGMSLGRVGLDFRHLFVVSFEQAMKPLVLRTMDQATSLLSVDILQAAIKDQVLPSTWLNTSGGEHTSSTPRTTTTTTTTPLSGKGTSNNNHPREQHSYQPPISLVDYPCLAVFTNGILTALNALRLLPVIGLYPLMNQHLNTCLLEVASAIKQYGDQVTQQFADESTFVDPFATAYARYCVPFLQRCLVEGIYGYSVGQEDDGGNNTSITKDIEVQLADYLITSATATTTTKIVSDRQDNDTTDDKTDSDLNGTTENNMTTENDTLDLQRDTSSEEVTENGSNDHEGREIDESNNDNAINTESNNDDTINTESNNDDAINTESNNDDPIDTQSNKIDPANTESIDNEPIMPDTTYNKTPNNDISTDSAKSDSPNGQAISNESINNDTPSKNALTNEDDAYNADQEHASKDDTRNIQQVNDTSNSDLRS